jgi:hypothetical protein
MVERDEGVAARALVESGHTDQVVRSHGLRRLERQLSQPSVCLYGGVQIVPVDEGDID